MGGSNQMTPSNGTRKADRRETSSGATRPRDLPLVTPATGPKESDQLGTPDFFGFQVNANSRIAESKKIPTTASNDNKKRSSTTPAADVIKEYTLAWPGSDATKSEQRHNFRVRFTSHIQCQCGNGSTHELVFDGWGYMWVSGQAYDHVARVRKDGEATFYEMPKGSAPHGLIIDRTGHLWVTLQGLGQLLRVDITNGWKIVETVDVNIYFQTNGGEQKINTQPHGVGLDDDGLVWFTGKQTSTVGRISEKFDHDEPRRVSHFPLLTTNAVPIYIAAGPDGNMWCTELYGNAIARISPKGVVTEYPIPKENSRPITIKASPWPDEKSMWFSQEASGNIGRIDMDGKITDVRIPLAERDTRLAALTFDSFGNFWLQQYISSPFVDPGNDYIVKLGRKLGKAPLNDISDVDVTYYKVPSKRSVLHRIVLAPDFSTIWFTEMGTDKIGVIDPNNITNEE